MRILVTPKFSQAIKDVTASYDALVELLESIEHFLNRLDIYTEITPTMALTEILVKILVELLFTLALATKQIQQGRASEFILIDALPNSSQRREICKEVLRGEGRRGGAAEAGSTHTG